MGGKTDRKTEGNTVGDIGDDIIGGEGRADDECKMIVKGRGA